MNRVCQLIIFLVICCGHPAAMAANGVRLSPGESVESQLSMGQVSNYVVDLPSGAHLVTVDQGDLDLIVEISEPFAFVVNSPTQRDDHETVLLEADKPVSVSIAISTEEYTGTTATYSIAVTHVGNPRIIAAHRLMSDAAQANQAGGDDRWQQALTAYSQAYTLWKEAGDVAEQARALFCVAFLQYWQFSQWSEAADSAAGAADLYARAGHLGLAANARHLQAASLIEAASEVRLSAETEAVAADAEAIFSEALSLFDAAAKAQAALNNGYDKAQTINNIGLTHFYRDDLALARQFFMQAAQEFRRLGEWSGELNPLANLAVIDHEKGRLSSAIKTYERLLELISADRESAWRADTLDNLAAAQLVLGNTDDALQNYFDALTIHEELESIKGQGRSVAGIGSTYLAIGEIKLAQEYLERALELRRTARDGKGQVADLRNLANIHRILGQIDVSLDYHRQALELATSPLVRARVQVQQARDWIDSGEYRRALAALTSAQEAADTGGALRISADAAYESGRLAVLRNEWADGERWLHRAHDLYAGIGSRAGQARSLLALAGLSVRADVHTAIAYALEAVDLVEDLRSEVADFELRAVYLGRRADYYEFLIGALIQASAGAVNDRAADDYVRRALEVSERARARATIDLINEAAIDFSQTIDAEILARQAELDARLIESVYRRDQLLEKNAEPDEIRAVVAELQEIRTELDVLEAEARRSSPRFQELSDPEVLDSKQIQALLDPDMVLLQYALGSVSSYLWIVTRDSVRLATIPERAAVNELARTVYASLAAPNLQQSVASLERAHIDELSAMILAPAASELQGRSRVVIAADDALQYLPFSVLSFDGTAPLYATHDVIVIPSLTAVAAQRRALLGREKPAMTLAVVGDPVFDDTDPRLVAQVATRSGATPVGPKIALGRLPFSGQEVNDIAALVDDAEKFVATGFAASKKQLSGSRLQNFRYVHFATHGLIDATNPALSTLAFSMRDESGRPVDGFFRLRDIYSMRLNADFVVMSACDTALGREIRGEGLIGLTQGFLYAGASRVIASLWRVPDRATAELMARFYTRVLDHGEDPIPALRNAQRDMTADRRWRDPYYWSGFVVQGDWL